MAGRDEGRRRSRRRSPPATAPRRRRSIAGSQPVSGRDGFSFPVGDGEGGGAYTDPAGHRYEGWYVATHLGDEYALGIHTSEDWNGRGGGDPFRPARDGGGDRQGGGRAAVFESLGLRRRDRIVLDGHEKRRVRSQYAHLSRIDVREPGRARARPIGAIGKDAEDISAHLHLEIRSDLALGPDVLAVGPRTRRRGSETLFSIRARSSARTASCPTRRRSRGWSWSIRRATACRCASAGG